MDVVVRAAVIYLFLLLLLRLTGKRTLSEVSTFDFVLLLIVSEATQNALIGDDNSLSTAMVVILTLVLLDQALSMLKAASRTAEKIAEGTPLVIVERGKVLEDCLRKCQVTESDVLQAARQTQGIERLDQIRYAVLESSGGISVIPEPSKMTGQPDDLDERIARAVARAMKEHAGKDAGDRR